MNPVATDYTMNASENHLPWTWLGLGLFLLAVTGCKLKFGDDIERSGAEFDAATLTQVSTLTGLSFPDGTEGLQYLYLGSGVDDALAAKVRIPDEQVEAFLENDVFRSGDEGKPATQIGKRRKWWNPDGLRERQDRRMDLPKARFLEVSCGREGEAFVAYLSWMTS